VSWLLMLKVMLITAILLAMTYAALRWYARRQHPGALAADRPELQCTSVLRLSAKTRIYRVRSNQSELLITESATGVSVTLLPSFASTQVLGAPQATSR